MSATGGPCPRLLPRQSCVANGTVRHMLRRAQCSSDSPRKVFSNLPRGGLSYGSRHPCVLHGHVSPLLSGQHRKVNIITTDVGTPAQPLVTPTRGHTAKEGRAGSWTLVGLTPKPGCPPLHLTPFPDLSFHPLPELRPQQKEEVTPLITRVGLADLAGPVSPSSRTHPCASLPKLHSLGRRGPPSPERRGPVSSQGHRGSCTPS